MAEQGWPAVRVPKIGRRNVNEMTETVLLQEGIIEFVNGMDFREGVRLVPRTRIAFGGSWGGSAELVAARILGTQEGLQLDPGLEACEWRVLPLDEFGYDATGEGSTS